MASGSPLTSASWSARDRLVAAVIIVYLVLQVGVPTVLLLRPRPQRFGWQMFTNAPVIPTVVVHRSSGRGDTVDVDRYFARRRPELTPGELDLLAPHVCRVTDDAALVEISVRRDSPPRRYPCR